MEMTYNEYNSSNNSGKKILFIFVFVILAGLSIVFLPGIFANDSADDIDGLLFSVRTDPSYSHAMAKHGADAVSVRNCLERNKPLFVLKETKTRYIRVCQLSETTFGFQVVDKVKGVYQERTAYIKESIKNIEQLMDYIKSNKNYTIIFRK